MLWSLRENGLTSLFKEVRAFKVYPLVHRFGGDVADEGPN